MENTPTTIGGCRILKKLGQGGMGAVYMAEHQTLGRRVAIKLLPPEFSASTESVARFLREARAAAQLQHPHIVPVYDAGEQGGQYYICMELVDGASLADLLKHRQRLEETVGLKFLEQAAEGLVGAHGAGMVHRDIKPDNLLVNANGVLKIADFGLVSDSAADSGLTQSGAMLGTPSYMSPEQCDGRKADERSDLYSLGASFFKLFTGEAPFNAPTPIAVLFKHAHEPTPDPRTRFAGLSEDTAALIQKLMAKKPEDRFQTASAVAEAVRELRAKLDPNNEASTAPSLPAIRADSKEGGEQLDLPPTLIGASPTPSNWERTPAGEVRTPSLRPVSHHGPLPGVVTPLPRSHSGTLEVPPRRLWTKVAVLLVVAALIGAGGFFGYRQYRENQIAMVRQMAQDLKTAHNYEAAIGKLDEAIALYPERGELRQMRDGMEIEWVQRRIERYKALAREQMDLNSYDEAITQYQQAIVLMTDRLSLPGFAPDPLLKDLMHKAEQNRDFEAAMKRGHAALKAAQYADAMEAFAAATKFEVQRVGEARQALQQARFGLLMEQAQTKEKEGDLGGALVLVEQADGLAVESTEKVTKRLRSLIRKGELLAQAQKDLEAQAPRKAAAGFEQAAEWAEVPEAGYLRERAGELVRTADFNDAAQAGEQALGRKEWKGALDAFGLALKLFPNSDRALTGVRAARVGELFEKSDALWTAGDWSGLEKMYQSIHTLDAENKELRSRELELKKRLQEIETCNQEFQVARNGKDWAAAQSSLVKLQSLDCPNKDRYQRLAAVIKFDQGMQTARQTFKNGDPEAALGQARAAMVYDPTGGQQALVLIGEIEDSLKVADKKANDERLRERVVAMVQSGQLVAARATLEQASLAAPDNLILRNQISALDGVMAHEAAVTGLVQIQAEAEASVQISKNENDDKKVDAWYVEVQSWKGRVDGLRDSARQAWLGMEYQKIQPSLAAVTTTARSMAAAFDPLAGCFRGKAADAGRDKLNVGGSLGGFGGGRTGGFGGFGASKGVGGNSKRAEIYASTAATLERCASEARRLGVER